MTRVVGILLASWQLCCVCSWKTAGTRDGQTRVGGWHEGQVHAQKSRQRKRNCKYIPVSSLLMTEIVCRGSASQLRLFGVLCILHHVTFALRGERQRDESCDSSPVNSEHGCSCTC